MSNPTGTGPEAGFGDYLTAMEDQTSVLLGHVVIYSVFDGDVTDRALAQAFTRLKLDPSRLPPPLRQDGAFEAATGKTVRRTYHLDGSVVAKPPPGGRRKRVSPGAQVPEATLMIRNVVRDAKVIHRNVVREIRDGKNLSLDYDSRVASCEFYFSSKQGPGAGQMTLVSNQNAIAKLPPFEQQEIHAFLDQIRDEYDRRCQFISGDRLRALVRTYVEELDATKIRKTGGVYFVPRHHDDKVNALRELVEGWGAGSALYRIPLPAQAEQREMIIKAFTDRTREDLVRLSDEIGAALDAGAPKTAVGELTARFQQVQESTDDYSQLLENNLDTARRLQDQVNMQLLSLLDASHV